MPLFRIASVPPPISSEYSVASTRVLSVSLRRASGASPARHGPSPHPTGTPTPKNSLKTVQKRALNSPKKLFPTTFRCAFAHGFSAPFILLLAQPLACDKPRLEACATKN
jgi:hypothetical protein